jgi:hypothetical protein
MCPHELPCAGDVVSHLVTHRLTWEAIRGRGEMSIPGSTPVRNHRSRKLCISRSRNQHSQRYKIYRCPNTSIRMRGISLGTTCTRTGQARGFLARNLPSRAVFVGITPALLVTPSRTTWTKTPRRFTARQDEGDAHVYCLGMYPQRFASGAAPATSSCRC